MSDSLLSWSVNEILSVCLCVVSPVAAAGASRAIGAWAAVDIPHTPVDSRVTGVLVAPRGEGISNEVRPHTPDFFFWGGAHGARK